jgi:alkylhydroperoxidase family enzyme
VIRHTDMLKTTTLSPLSPLPVVRLWNDKAAWAKMRQKILDSPMSELDVVMLEKELSKVIAASICVCLYGIGE